MKSDERKCSKCAEIVKKEAQVCKHCGHEFSSAEINGYKKADADAKRNGTIGCIVLVVALFALGKCALAPSEEDKAKQAAEAKAEETKKADERRKGFHCLSSWDGSNRSTVEQITRNLRNPDSFEHVETRIAPANKDGKHPLTMEYRAQNGFGGMNVGRTVAMVNPETCDATILANEGNS
ncbi:zinc ribbon domain-containing protein [Sphingobium sp. TomMM35A]